jgi:hypothetical protein
VVMHVSAEPTYSLEERQAMRQEELATKEAAHTQALISSSYKHVDIPTDLGLDCGSYKWKQNQTYVEVYIPLPDDVDSVSKISVELKPDYISIDINERSFLKGSLYREIKAEDSTWYIQDGVLEIILLKLSRRGQYANGETNANTFWRSVLKSPTNPDEILHLENVPSVYYRSPFEVDGRATVAKPRRAIKA